VKVVSRHLLSILVISTLSAPVLLRRPLLALMILGACMYNRCYKPVSAIENTLVNIMPRHQRWGVAAKGYLPRVGRDVHV
jgi:hypothetical protein